MEYMNSSKKNIILLGSNGGIGSQVLKKLTTEEFNVIEIDKRNLDLVDTINLKSNLLKIIGKKIISGVIYTSGVILDTQTENNPTAKEIAEILAVNTLSPIIIHNVLQDIISENAIFVYLSSTATIKLNGLFPIYTTSKMASETFFKIQVEKIKRQENKFKKIICILPGPTNTPMREKIAKDAHAKQSPEIIADLVREILNFSDKFENGDKIVIKNSEISKINTM